MPPKPKHRYCFSPYTRRGADERHARWERKRQETDERKIKTWAEQDRKWMLNASKVHKANQDLDSRGLDVGKTWKLVIFPRGEHWSMSYQYKIMLECEKFSETRGVQPSWINGGFVWPVSAVLDERFNLYGASGLEFQDRYTWKEFMPFDRRFNVYHIGSRLHTTASADMPFERIAFLACFFEKFGHRVKSTGQINRRHILLARKRINEIEARSYAMRQHILGFQTLPVVLCKVILEYLFETPECHYW